MIAMPDGYYEKVTSANRDISLKINFNDETDIDESLIISGTLSETMVSGSMISIGDSCSNCFKLSMVMPETPLKIDGGYIKASVLINGYTVPLGVYYITSVTSSDDYKTVTIEAYDKMSQLAETYTPRVGTRAWAEDIVEDICNQYGLTLADGVEIPDERFNIVDCSVKEMLGYIAGFAGKNCCIDRYGKLNFKWYNAVQYSIDEEQQYMNGFTRTSAEDITITALTSGTSGNTFTVGSGTGITFTNPYLNKYDLEDLLDVIKGFSYTPSALKFRGDPALEIGDVVLITDLKGITHNVPVMKQEFIFGGGMNCLITSVGETDSQSLVMKSPTDKKLEVQYSNLMNDLKIATQTILGAKGGYYSVQTDNNGNPVGWTIKTTDGTKRWICNIGGIGYSSDGGKTLDVAIDMDGHIDGKFIAAHSISSDSVIVGDKNLGDYLSVDTVTIDGEDKIVLKIGDNSNQIVLVQMNDKIAFYNNATDFSDRNLLAYFSNSSFEIINLKRFRIGDFAFIPRTNGNLSLTKI